MTDTPRRLDAHLAAQLGCSRREAQRLIEGGRVTLDGQVADDPRVPVSPRQRAELMAEPPAHVGELLTLLLNKPAGSDAGGEGAAHALFPPAGRAPGERGPQRLLRGQLARLRLATPLGEASSGLAVFTQDGQLQRALSAEAGRFEHEFEVSVAEAPAPAALERLRRGAWGDGEDFPPAKASLQSERRLRIVLKGAEPGLVARMCEAVGLQVTGLRRVRIGRVSLAGLAPGQWRTLGAGERF